VQSVRWIAIAALVVVYAGCDTGPKLYPATGTVSLDGKPLDGAMVVFVPEKAPPGKPLSILATSDTSGKYAIATDGSPGAPAGKYKVTVTKSSGTTLESPTAEDMRKIAEKGMMKSELLVPVAYTQAANSPLTATVTTDGSKNVFPLELKQ